MIITVDKCPYDEGDVVFRGTEFEIHPGLTILVGCNGSGKSTLLREIERQMEKNDVKVFKYNNCSDGGHNAVGAGMYFGNYQLAASLLTSSEGEQVFMNFGDMMSKLGAWRKTHDGSACVLVDGLDSGTSIDLQIQIKEFLHWVVAQQNGQLVYLIITANTFELSKSEDCIDVTTAKHITFDTYTKFRNFVMKTSVYKDRRYKKQQAAPKPRRGRS